MWINGEDVSTEMDTSDVREGIWNDHKTQVNPTGSAGFQNSDPSTLLDLGS